jgi:hypothetical protein
VRVILTNEDAARVAALMQDNPDAGLRVETREWVGEGGTVWVILEGGLIKQEFSGKARRTPGKVGSFVIEDWDGRIIAEGEPPA